MARPPPCPLPASALGAGGRTVRIATAAAAVIATPAATATVAAAAAAPPPRRRSAASPSAPVSRASAAPRRLRPPSRTASRQLARARMRMRWQRCVGRQRHARRKRALRTCPLHAPPARAPRTRPPASQLRRVFETPPNDTSRARAYMTAHASWRPLSPPFLPAHLPTLPPLPACSLALVVIPSPSPASFLYPSCKPSSTMSARPSRSDLNICDEPSSSTLFLPFPSFYVRQLREASHPLLPDDDDDDIGSEPSDDGAERRYSDVSVHSDHLPVNHSLIHCSSVKRSSYTLCSRTKSYPHPRFDPKHSIGLSSSARRTQPFIRPHSLSRRLSPSPKRLSTKALNPPTSPSVSATPVLAYHDPLLVARRSPSTPSYLRFTSNQPQSQTSSCLPAAYQPSRSPRCSTPSNSCSPTTMQRSPRPNPASPFLHPVRSLQADNRYTFCTPPTSNSLPSFDLGRKQPYPTKTRSLAPQHPPVSEPHRSKRASFWKLISGKRLSRREKKPKQPQPQPPMPDQPVRKARPWKYDSFKLKRRSSLRNFSAYPATLANRPPEQTKSLPSSPLYQRKRHRRARASDRASFSAYSVDDVGGRTRGESLSLSHLVQPTRTRLAYYADEKREASSFAGPRARVFVTAEGSSVSSSSDREEDALFCIPDSNSYLSRRQLRAMQYK